MEIGMEQDGMFKKIPALKINHTRPYRGITWIEILVGIVILVVLVGVITPLFLKPSRPAKRAQATNNAKEIGSALFGFIDRYGGYPSKTTLEQLRAEGIKVLPIGNDANSYLGQLLAADCVDSEKIFYVKGVSSREGDNDFNSPETMLAKGENGFGYVMMKGDKPLVNPGSIVPILLAPLKSGGSDPLFDEDPFEGQYIYLTPDGAVSGGKIGKDGRPLAKGRAGGLFGPGENSVFGNDIPDVKMPR